MQTRLLRLAGAGIHLACHGGGVALAAKEAAHACDAAAGLALPLRALRSASGACAGTSGGTWRIPAAAASTSARSAGPSAAAHDSGVSAAARSTGASAAARSSDARGTEHGSDVRGTEHGSDVRTTKHGHEPGASASARGSSSSGVRAPASHDDAPSSSHWGSDARPRATSARAGGRQCSTEQWVSFVCSAGAAAKPSASPPAERVPPLEALRGSLRRGAKPGALRALTPVQLTRLVWGAGALLKGKANARRHAALAGDVHALHAAAATVLLARGGGAGSVGALRAMDAALLTRLLYGMVYAGGALPRGFSRAAADAVAAAVAALPRTDPCTPSTTVALLDALAALHVTGGALRASVPSVAALLARVAEMRGALDGHRLSRAVRSVGRLRAADAVDVPALARCFVAALRAPLLPAHVHDVLHPCMRMRVRLPPDDVSAMVAFAAVPARAGAARPRELPGILTAASWLWVHASSPAPGKPWGAPFRVAPSALPAVEALCSALESNMAGGGRPPPFGDVVEVAKGLARLAVVPPPGLAAHLLARWGAAADGGGALDAASAATLLRCAAQLGLRPPHALALRSLALVADSHGAGAAARAAADGAAADKAVYAAAAMALWASAALRVYEPAAAHALAAVAGAQRCQLLPITATQLLQAHEAYRLLAPPDSRVEALLPPALLAACRKVVAEDEAKTAAEQPPRAATARAELLRAAGALPQLEGVRAAQPVGVDTFEVDVLATHAGGGGRPVAIHLLAPHMYYANAHRVCARFELRADLLRALGYAVVHVPADEWDALAGRGDEQRTFLSALVEREAGLGADGA